MSKVKIGDVVCLNSDLTVRFVVTKVYANDPNLAVENDDYYRGLVEITRYDKDNSVMIVKEEIHEDCLTIMQQE